MESKYMYGRLMFLLNADAKSLESRINKLGPIVTPSLARDVVTGYIEAAIEAGSGVENAYSLLHGFGKWLCDWDTEGLSGRVTRALAKETISLLEKDASIQDRRYDPLQNIADIVRDDYNVRNHIAKELIISYPDYAMKFAAGDDRPAILRSIADGHRDNLERIRIVMECLSELKDTKSMVCVARQYMALINTPNQPWYTVISDHGSNEDKIAAAKEMHSWNRSRTEPCHSINAYNLLSGKDMTLEGIDLRLTIAMDVWHENKDVIGHVCPRDRETIVAKMLGKRDVSTHDSLQSFLWLGGKGISEEGQAKRLEIARNYVKTHPKDAYHLFKQSGFEDKQIWISLASRLLEDEESLRAFQCYYGRSKVECYPQEMRKIGILELNKREDGSKDPTDGWRDGEMRKTYHNLLMNAAFSYLDQGGKALVVDNLIREGIGNPNIPDDMSRTLALSLAREKLMDRCYDRLNKIKQKSQHDLRFSDGVRRRMIRDYLSSGKKGIPLLFYAHGRDTRALTMLAEMAMKSHPENAYSTAQMLNDKNLVRNARKAMVEQDAVGALAKFRSNNDPEGVSLAEEHIIQGLDKKIAETLLFGK